MYKELYLSVTHRHITNRNIYYYRIRPYCSKERHELNRTVAPLLESVNGKQKVDLTKRTPGRHATCLD